MISNAPSSGPSFIPPVETTRAVTPNMVPEWAQARQEVITNTKGSLNNLADATLPLAAAAGMVGIMAYGMKMMATGKPSPLLSKNA